MLMMHWRWIFSSSCWHWIPTSLALYLCYIFALSRIIPIPLVWLCVLLFFSGERADHPGAAVQPAKCWRRGDSQQLWDRQPGTDSVCQLLWGQSTSATSDWLRGHRHGAWRPSLSSPRVSNKSVWDRGNVKDWCGSGCVLQHQQQGRPAGRGCSVRQQGQHQHDVPAADRSPGPAGDWSHAGAAPGGVLHWWSCEEERLLTLYRWAMFIMLYK